MVYRIKSVERLTGLSRSTITAWERRYGLLEPRKDDSGYRVYTEADVAFLLRVKRHVEEGFQIQEAIALARDRVVPVTPDVRPGEATLDALYTRLLAFDRAGADAEHARVADLPFRTRLEDVYRPLLVRVGEEWEAGKATIAQEHFVSAFCREQLVGVLRSLDHGPADGPVAVCAGIPHEPHELGLLMVASHLAMRGNRVVYMGADLPTEELAAWVEDHGADLVIQSSVAPPSPEAVLAHVRTLRDRLPARALLVVGGPGVGPIRTEAIPGVLLCPTMDDLLAAWEQVRVRRLQRLG